MAHGPITRDSSTIALGLAQIRVGPTASYITIGTSILPEAYSLGALADTKFVTSTEYWKLESGFPATEDWSIPLKDTASLECSFKEITPRNMALARGLDPFNAGTGFDVSGPIVLGSSANTGILNTAVVTPITVAGTSNDLVDTYTIRFTSDTVYSVTSSSGNTVVCTSNGGVASIAMDSTHSVNGLTGFTIKANAIIDKPNTTGLAANCNFRFVLYKNGYATTHAGTIGLGNLKSPAFMRMEAVYTYPNAENHMYIIFPRCNVTSAMEIAFQAKDNAAPSITFEAKNAASSTVGGNAIWDDMPLGVVVFD